MESDDLNDPIADAARSLLDGHVVLSRDLANKGHYPAVDVLQSVSRLRREITDAAHIADVGRIVELMSVHRDSEDLINIGAYSAGSNPKIDEAIAYIDGINLYLKQEGDVSFEFDESRQNLRSLIELIETHNGK